MVDKVLHKDQAGGQVHEPKGIETASVGQWYTADGAGSGTWDNSGSLSLVCHNFQTGPFRPIVKIEVLLLTMDSIELLTASDYVYLEVDGVEDPSYRVYLGNTAMTYSDQSAIIDYSSISGLTPLQPSVGIVVGHSNNSTESLSTTCTNIHYREIV